MYVACCYVEHLHRGNRKEKTGAYCIWEHAPKALAAGDELCISYECGELLPLAQLACQQPFNAFLAYGFVLVEFLPACKS